MQSGCLIIVLDSPNPNEKRESVGKCAFVWLAGLMVCLLWQAEVLAHGAGLQITQQGKTLSIEGYYEDNSPTLNAKVTLASADGVVLATYPMDHQGLVKIPVPGLGKFQILLDTGDGHLMRKSILITEVETTQGKLLGDGPTRKEFTEKNLWLRALIGLALVAASALAVKWFWKPLQPSSPTNQEIP